MQRKSSPLRKAVLLCFQNLAQLAFNIYCGLRKQESIDKYLEDGGGGDCY